MSSTALRVWFVTASLCLLLAVVMTAAADDKKTVADKVYSAAQADRGESRFKTSCSSCHTANSFSGGAFAERWSGQSLGQVFEFISNVMPENDPGSLKAEEYVSVMAYILRSNGYPSGDTDLPTDPAALKNIAVDTK
jgi:mono/diheme cytochrome c family protein